MLQMLFSFVLGSMTVSTLPPHACDQLGIERGTQQVLPEIEPGNSTSFMLEIDGIPRLVRLVPWSIRSRGFSVEGDPAGLVDRRERLCPRSMGLNRQSLVESPRWTPWVQRRGAKEKAVPAEFPAPSLGV